MVTDYQHDKPAAIFKPPTMPRVDAPVCYVPPGGIKIQEPESYEDGGMNPYPTVFNTGAHMEFLMREIIKSPLAPAAEDPLRVACAELVSRYSTGKGWNAIVESIKEIERILAQ